MTVVAFKGKNSEFGLFLEALREIAAENPNYIQEQLAIEGQLIGYGHDE